MSIRIGVFGAFDRFNFGDLLFPITIEHALRKYGIAAELEYYATTDSDLRKYGGNITRSIKTLTEDISGRAPEVVIVAGGEVLDPSWTTIYSYLVPKFIEIGLRASRRLINEKIPDLLSRTALGVRLPFPFVLSPDDVPASPRIVYNAVGGSALERMSRKSRNLLVSKLSQASFISVRDRKTKNILDSLDMPVASNLAPDSAIIISDIFPRNSLIGKVRPIHRETLTKHRGQYICFQSGRYCARGYESTIARQLSALYVTMGLPIIFLPTGTATGIEDQVAFRRIKKHLPRTVVCMFPHELTVLETMAYIAHARIFVGTSLHGVITAISFAVPHVGFTAHVQKLKEFLGTWFQSKQATPVDYNNLAEAVQSAVAVPQRHLYETRDNLIASSYRNFDMMFRVICPELKPGVVPETGPTIEQNQL